MVQLYLYLGAPLTHHLPSHRYNRRQFIEIAAAATLASSQLPARAADQPLKVAAVFTEFTYRSHAHVLLENFLEPYYFNGKKTSPGCKIVSFFADQIPAERDMARQVAQAYKIPIY